MAGVVVCFFIRARHLGGFLLRVVSYFGNVVGNDASSYFLLVVRCGNLVVRSLGCKSLHLGWGSCWSLIGGILLAADF